MRYPWLIRLHCGSDLLPEVVTETKSAAVRYSKEWVAEAPGRTATILRRPNSPVLTLVNVSGELRLSTFHKRAQSAPTGRPRCTAEKIDRLLQNTGFSTREARRVRLTLIEILLDAIEQEGLVWAPAGVLIIEAVPPIRRPRNRFDGLGFDSEGRRRFDKFIFHHNRLTFLPSPSVAARPEVKEYDYKQYGRAIANGQIDPPPPKEVGPTPIVAALRPTEGWKQQRNGRNLR